MKPLWAALLAALVLAVACGDDGGGDASSTATAESGTGFRVVVTTTQIADFARNVAGDAARVTSLVGPSQDPHQFEPLPETVRAVADADLVLRNGLGLDGYLDDLLGAAGDAPVVTVTKGIAALQGDPHVWFSVANAKAMVVQIRDALVKADPENADSYRANAKAYLAELDRLEAYVRSETERVPLPCRKLVTQHRVLSHFAAAYDFEVLATVIAGGSTEARPSARDIATAADLVRRAGVKVIFAEASEDPELMERVAREARATVQSLYLDSFGPEGSAADSYIGMMETNTRRVVSALEGCLP